MFYQPKHEIMKRVALFLLTLAVPALMMAQNDAIDKLINKYKGQEGVTVVNIGPELFQVVKGMEIEDLEEQDIPLEKVSSVRILTIEDNEALAHVNFYDELEKNFDVSNLTEVMTVDDGGEQVRMWMRNAGGNVQEFLLVVSGDDNVLIHITGDFNLKDLEGLAESFGEDIDIDL
jgi:SepF-like predicted cell division protein (DUF552 family)